MIVLREDLQAQPATESEPQVSPVQPSDMPLDQMLNAIRADSKNNSKQYIDSVNVPGGGE